MVRARSDILRLLPASALSTRIVLSWCCRAPSDGGLPSNDDYDEITSFEETLVNFVEEGAILAFVITSDGIVEYSFYTSDSGWFIERLNEAFAGQPRMPIEIAAEEDPDWAEYRAVMSAVGADGSAK